MKRGFYYIISLFSIFLLWSCSTQKNTKASRFYHAFNSRYNIYYNGKTSFDQALKSMQDGYQESYADMIYMFPISAQPKDKETTGGPFDRAIDKGNKAIRLHSIKTKPPKKPGWRNDPKQVALQEIEEYNPFLKKCWLLIGYSQFYNADFLQAAATFSYIARHYSHDQEIVTEARLWQARAYAEMNWLFESEDALKKQYSNGIPVNQTKLYSTVYADHLVKNGQFEEAIPHLKIAIKAEKNKRQRSRMKYLLGQLYAEQGTKELAYKAYGDVIRGNPPYDLEFAARIRQTEVFPGGNYQKAVRMLQRMSKNPKNTNYLDQVYYALGNLFLNNQDTIQAVQNYEMAIEKSVQHGMDKAICQIKLGDLYFSMREYVKAQPCFSGALGILSKEYKEYKRVAKLSSVLDELVVHVEAVHLQDSLQTLVRMPEEQRLAAIDKIIEQTRKEQEEAKALAEKEAYLAEQEARGSGINRPGTETGGIVIPTASSGSSFYFYNPQTVAQGKTQFQRLWGRRTLEDNWRRRDKTINTFVENWDDETDYITQDEDQPTDILAEIENEISIPVADDPLTREYYLQQLPFTEEDIIASNMIIIDGLYQMAMIYKDKLEDIPLSIEAFEELEKRFPDNQYLLESYFQIYLMALRQEDQNLMSQYRNKIIAQYPSSDYAQAVSDPNYAYNVRMMDHLQDSIYQQTYQQYLTSNIMAVRQGTEQAISKYPLGKLNPKFMFLDALTYVQEGDAEGFKEALKTLLEKYPDADVSDLAGEMLKGLLRGRTMMQGSITGMAWNLRLGIGEGDLSAEDSARIFNPEKEIAHRLLLIYPNGILNNNQLLFTVAAYNFSNFLIKQLDLSQEEAGPMHILTVSGFSNFDEITQYIKLIYQNDGYASRLSREVTVLPISTDNYETLMRGKTLEEYIHFFDENFRQELPDLIARWKVQIEEEPFDDNDVLLPEPEEDIEEYEKEEEKLLSPDITESVIEKDSTTIIENNIPEIKITEKEKELTFREIEELRKREAEEAEIRKEEENKIQAEKELQEKLLQEQQEKEKTEALKKQKEEEQELLKLKREREKQQQQERNEKEKRAQADRKAKQKAQKQLRKEKEKEYKARQKQREKERKQKEQEYRQQLKEKEKARREAQKSKQSINRNK